MFDIKGVSPANGEEKRVTDALAALAKDPHAPREISVKLTLHVHNEYPKLLYKGKHTRVVADATEEKAAAVEGFGAFVAEKPAEE
jgi:hypothetical protein